MLYINCVTSLIFLFLFDILGNWGLYLRLIAQIMIFILGVWALFAGLIALWGYSFSFPFEFSQSTEEIPFHRWQIVRVSVFLTFGYLAIRHFLFGTEKMFPIQFLDIYLKSVGVSGLVIYYQQDITEYREYATLGFFLLAALLSHFLARPEYKKIFFKR